MEKRHSNMKFQVLAFLLLLACMYPSLAQGSYENCCLKYVAGMGKGLRKLTVGYRVQETDGGCNIPAIVFRMRSGRQICAEPRQAWVKQIMKRLDVKNKGA